MTCVPEADIELGCHNGAVPSNDGCSWPSWLKTWANRRTVATDASFGVHNQIESFLPGYPRFSALLSSHPSFHICRRFSTLRTRLLLLKQDRLVVLEKQLEQIDREESSTLSLGSCRRDINEERHAVISEINNALVDYDSFLERHRLAMSFDAAPYRAVTSLWNWVNGNGCMARAETAYLEQGEDLVSLTTQEDNAVAWLEALVEYACVTGRAHFGAAWPGDAQCNPSRDPNVHIFPPSLMRRSVRILLAPFITVILLAPVILCNFVGSLTARLAIVVIATSGFIAVLSSFTRARTIELTVAGATYTTVLVVFISSTDGPAS